MEDIQIRYGTVDQWIKAMQKDLSVVGKESINAVEIDEIFSYIGRKKALLDMDCC